MEENLDSTPGERYEQFETSEIIDSRKKTHKKKQFSLNQFIKYILVTFTVFCLLLLLFLLTKEKFPNIIKSPLEEKASSKICEAGYKNVGGKCVIDYGIKATYFTKEDNAHINLIGFVPDIPLRMTIDGKIVESASAPSTVSSPTQLTGNTNRDKIYNYLTGMGFSSAGAAAVMGNLRQESGFSANNVQDGMGYSDEDYVADIKSGKISREEFMNDGRGFGIAQWTYPARKAKLYDKLGAQNIDSLEGQLDFMYNEMGEDLRNSMKTADDVNSATTKFHNVYERSADTSMSGRQSFAREVYDAYNA